MTTVSHRRSATGGWRRTTALILLWQVTASLCFYSVYAVTPFVRDGFGASRTRVGVLLTALTLGYTVSLVPVGSITDEYGERLVLALGTIGLGLGVAAITVVRSYLALLAAVFVLGAFYATAMPGTNRAVFNAIPEERINTSMGIKQVGVTAGSGISAVVVPWFGAMRFGWETAFLLAGLTAVIVSLAFWRTYETNGTAGTGAGLGIRAHFRSPGYVLLATAGFFLGAGLFTTVGYTILYVDEALEASVVFAGVTLAAAQVAGSAGRIGFGWLADALSTPPTISTLGILAGQAGFSALLFLAVPFVDAPLPALIVFSLLGFVVLGFTGIYYSCIGSIVPTADVGSATAGGQIALNSGALIAPPLFGYLVDTHGYGAGWNLLALGSLVAFGLLLSLVFRIRSS